MKLPVLQRLRGQCYARGNPYWLNACVLAPFVLIWRPVAAAASCSKLLQQLSHEAGVTMGGKLYADALSGLQVQRRSTCG